MVTMSHFARHQLWTDVAMFKDLNAGEALKTFLTGKGLQARTYDDNLFRHFLFLRPPRVTYRVQVRQNDIQSADEFVAANAPAALQGAIRCPSCGSLRISYPQMTRKFVLPTIMLHLGIIFRVIGHRCYCDHCHFLWSLPEDNIRAAPKTARPFPFSHAG